MSNNRVEGRIRGEVGKKIFQIEKREKANFHDITVDKSNSGWWQFQTLGILSEYNVTCVIAAI